MKVIAVSLLLALLAVVSACTGDNETTTSAAPSTTVTTVTTTTSAGVNYREVERARAELEEDLTAFRESLEGLRTLSLSSTQSDFETVRETIEASWEEAKQSAATLRDARGGQIQGAADELERSAEAVEQAWNGVAQLVEGVQSGTMTVREAVLALPGELRRSPPRSTRFPRASRTARPPR